MRGVPSAKLELMALQRGALPAACSAVSSLSHGCGVWRRHRRDVLAGSPLPAPALRLAGAARRGRRLGAVLASEPARAGARRHGARTCSARTRAVAGDPPHRHALLADPGHIAAAEGPGVGGARSEPPPRRWVWRAGLRRRRRARPAASTAASALGTRSTTPTGNLAQLDPRPLGGAARRGVLAYGDGPDALDRDVALGHDRHHRGCWPWRRVVGLLV